MALTDEQWLRITTFMEYKAKESGQLMVGDPNLVTRMMREHWDLFSDDVAMDAYINSQLLAELQAEKIRLTRALRTVQTKIDELEGG